MSCIPCVALMLYLGHQVKLIITKISAVNTVYKTLLDSYLNKGVLLAVNEPEYV